MKPHDIFVQTSGESEEAVLRFLAAGVDLVAAAHERGDWDSLRRAVVQLARAANAAATYDAELDAMLAWVDHPEPNEHRARWDIAAARMNSLRLARLVAIGAAYGHQDGRPLDDTELQQATSSAIATAIDAGASLEVVRGILEEHLGGDHA